MKPYLRFGGMVLISTIVMFIFKYFSTFKLDHIFFSETRAYMALLMGATMTIIMLVFMLHMLKNLKVNIGIAAVSIVVFSISLFLLRSQTLVDDVDYMEGMIPHHSIAILTSERAEITDPRVRDLADEIIEAQRKEITEMKNLIEDLEDE
jgi:cellobiose-specific phosphotransferase system component IIC